MQENQVKFLIIRFSSIGDIVLTTPIIRALKTQVEGAVVHYFTKPEYKTILENNPYIDKIHVLKSYKESIYELKDEGFDYIIDLHNNLRTWHFKNRLKIMDFSFPKLNWEKYLMVRFKKNKLPDIHIVDRYFETVKLFDANNDNKGLDYFIPENDKVNISDYLKTTSKEYIAYSIGGQHFTKKLPVEKISELCSKIDKTIILLGGKEDFENGQIIISKNSNCINLCGKLNLNQSASVIEQSSYVISHDTGLMHIAAAFKKDIISIWGNTIPEFGMFPYQAGEKSKIFEVKNLKCRPCSKIGFKKCPKKHFNCMQKQDIEKIAEIMKH
ncbi:MAG: glycosyltransferase family 9 protein [Bacteroidales bacterium]|jgi:ADP-heptose:LPS heptosyltransferase|nr:glycosyltransferase family 9 protein [Bacteroidales bacterium]MDY0314672.1 glycosyltransferase family 9 protein [Bacteroidales bacterium]NLB85584.1 glycosyltransferase family 9 protein [Bacteroidales bacterium]